MKNFLKLLNFELGRFGKIYLVLVGITVLSQLLGTYFMTNRYMKAFNDAIYLNGLSTEQFLNQNGQFNLTSMFSSMWYNLPILFAAAILVIYCFFIWYRDWFGKNTFIYRLLTLPTARINIFFSKAVAIFLMVLGLVALQILLLIAASNILKWMIPANLRTDLTIMDAILNSYGNYHLSLLIPPTFIDFLIHYGVGFTAVFLVFTAVLMERSFRLKGLILGIIYSVLAIVVLNLPQMIIVWTQKSYLYPIELFGVQVILWAIITITTIFISNYLLNKKVTV